MIRPNASFEQISIPVLPDRTETVDQLVNQVWNVIDSWGIAGTGGYWKPKLIADVEPGGQANFLKLQSLLEGSGLELERKKP